MVKYLLLIFLLVSVVGVAQVHVSGRVMVSDGSDGPESAVGATVICPSTSEGVVADADGRFSFRCSQPLPITFEIRYVGYETQTYQIESPNKANGIVITLVPHSSSIVEVDVTAVHKGAGFQRIDASEALKAVDAHGGIESVVKTQMGVASNSELSSQYRVRGGNFDENMVYVGGVEIYRPFLIRSGEQEGLSFVNPDMVGSLTFSSGGFDASYADRMSSVLDVRYKTPRQSAGSVRASMLGASAHAEGCIGQSVTHITGARYKTSRYILGSLDTQGDYDPEFVDVQSYWTFSPSKSLSFDVLGYYAFNSYRFVPQNRETSFGTLTDTKRLTIYFEGEEADSYHTGIAAASVHYSSPSRKFFLDLVSSVYRSAERENYDILGEYWLQQADQADSDEGVNQGEGIGVGGYRQHARNELVGGIYSTALRATHYFGEGSLQYEGRYQRELFTNYVDEWEQRDSAGYTIRPETGLVQYSHVAKADNNHSANRFQAYLMRNRSFFPSGSILAFNYGVRLSYLSSCSQWLFSPRASVRLSRGNTIFRLSGGRYCQSPLFRELQRADGSLNTDVRAQDSWQVLAGFDLFFSLADHPFKFTAEAYNKWISSLNSYSIDNVRIRYSALNNAHGYACGLDLKVNGELAGGAESWACLSLLSTAEDIDDDGAGYIPRPSDQRVSFSMFVQDHMPSNKSLGATLNLYLASGLPFGPPDAPRAKAVNRMPGYKRVDMGFFKDFALLADGRQRWQSLRSARLGVEVFNLFDFSNTISHFWVEGMHNRTYAVPNYLTSRRLNLKLMVEF